MLVIGMSNHRAGIETFLYSYTSRFQNSVIDFVSFSEKIVFEDELISRGHNVLRVPSRNDNFFAHYRELNRIIKENNYDVVWINSVNLSYILPIRLAYRYSVPTRIIHAHGSKLMGSKYTKLLHYFNRNKIYKYTTDFWTCSIDSGKWMFPKLDLEEVIMVKNAVNLDEFTYVKEEQERLGRKLGVYDKKIIGTVGRLSAVKNQIRLLSIFKLILERERNVHLIIVGEGPERTNIEEYIRNNKLENSVTLLGSIDYIPKVLSLMDVFVLPSFSEGLPIVLVESQAVGLKCLVATTVDNEDVRLTNLLEFLSLESTDKQWADSIISNLNYDRNNRTEEIREAGFDINIEAKKLEEWFLNRNRSIRE